MLATVALISVSGAEMITEDVENVHIVTSFGLLQRIQLRTFTTESTVQQHKTTSTNRPLATARDKERLISSRHVTLCSQVI